MWRWIWGNKKPPAADGVDGDTEDISWEASSQAGSESDVDIGDEEDNLTRAVLRHLRDLRRRHNKYAETVDQLCKKVDGLVEEFHPVVIPSSSADVDEQAAGPSSAQRQSIAKQLESEMSKLKEKVDQMDATKRGSKKMEMFWNMTNEYEVCM